jgi:short-subunit dehydrogenase
MNDMKTYQGITALITGASSGIGKSLAELLASQGANLVIAARSRDKLEELATSLRTKHRVQIAVVPVDLSRSDGSRALFEATRSMNLEIDLLVNNAGFGKWGDFLEFDSATYAEMMQLNINSVVELCHLYLPSMLKKRAGGIINVASTAAFLPVPFASVYSASKSFVLFFSEALHGEYKSKGLTVMALCPGGTESNFANVANAAVELPKAGFDTAESVARTALAAFLNSKSSVITGRKNYFPAAILPRLLPREWVIQLSGNIWKRFLKDGGARVSELQ